MYRHFFLKEGRQRIRDKQNENCSISFNPYSDKIDHNYNTQYVYIARKVKHPACADAARHVAMKLETK